MAPDDDRAAPRTWVVALAAAVRALSVGLSVVLLACGLTLILWASAPDSTADAANAVQAGVVAFAAAHLVPVTLGGVTVSISPLLVSGAVLGLLSAVTRRARLRPVGRTQEVVAVLSTAAVYGLFVSVVARSFAPAGSVPPTAVLTAGAMALVAAAWGTAAPGSALRGWWAGTPLWLRLGARAGTAAALALLAAGALAVVAGLILSFSSVAALTGLVAPGVGAGLGLTVLQLLLVPNAAVAGTGYVTGVGFQIGQGDYTPFGSTVVDLPAVPLFAAAPEGVAASVAGLVWLVVPVAVAVLVGWWVAQRTRLVADRFLAVGTAAVVAGVALCVLALVARGGVQGGPIAATGAPAALLGGVVVAGVAVVGGLTVLAQFATALRAPRPAAPVTSTPRRRAAAAPATAAGAASSGDGGDGRPTDGNTPTAVAGEDASSDQAASVADEDTAEPESPESPESTEGTDRTDGTGPAADGTATEAAQDASDSPARSGDREAGDTDEPDADPAVAEAEAEDTDPARAADADADPADADAVDVAPSPGDQADGAPRDGRSHS
nr:DUF6350 family protein [Nakamurella flavida]